MNKTMNRTSNKSTSRPRITIDELRYRAQLREEELADRWSAEEYEACVDVLKSNLDFGGRVGAASACSTFC